MKKLMTGMAAAALALALAACSPKNDSKAADSDSAALAAASEATPEMVYAGKIPAADADGINYTLSLAYTDSVKGTYALQTRVDGDKAAVSDSKGAFTVENGTGKNAGKRYLRLAPEAGGDAYNFLIESDSTIIMVNDMMEPAPSGLNYTLTLK